MVALAAGTAPFRFRTSFYFWVAERAVGFVHALVLASLCGPLCTDSDTTNPLRRTTFRPKR
jgi:hypothetical protein